MSRDPSDPNLVEVTLRFGKDCTPLVVDVSKSASHLKRSVSKITGVPPSRLKLFARGSGGWRGDLPDSADLSSLGIKRGQVLMASGSKPRASLTSDWSVLRQRWTWLGAAGAAALAACVYHLWRGPSSVPLSTVYYASLSGVTFVAWGWDKLAAKLKPRRRTPEKTLLALSILGGWPGGIAGILGFQHKSVKVSFLLKFLGTVVVNSVMLLWLNRRGLVSLPSVAW